MSASPSSVGKSSSTVRIREVALSERGLAINLNGVGWLHQV